MDINIVRAKAPTNADALVILSNLKDLNWSSDYFSKKVCQQMETYVSNKQSYFCYNSEDQLTVVFFVEKDEDANYSKENYRNVGNSLLQIVDTHNLENVDVIDHSSSNNILDFTEGFILGSYCFDKYKTNKSKKCKYLNELRLITDEVSDDEIQVLVNTAKGTFVSRNLVNEPFSYLTALKMSDEITALGAQYGFDVEIFDKNKIESLKMGGILAVNKGSITPPRFNILTYNPKNAINKKPIVLVGKGIVYDTGGLSLKPTGNSMDFMKSDMGGAATVIGAFVALAANKLPLHVVGLIPSTDNAVSAESYAPGDVITMYDGTTVEVMNTDAEGRLVLADALHYAKKYDPELVIDFATLTGSAAQAVGTEAICLMSTAPDEVNKKIIASGDFTHERIVQLPLWKEYDEYLKSHIADMRNLGTSPAAGMITAGKFLQHFTDYNWMHFDIAGSAFLKAAKSYRPKEGSGIGVRLCFDFLKNYK